MIQPCDWPFITSEYGYVRSGLLVVVKASSVLHAPAMNSKADFLHSYDQEGLSRHPNDLFLTNCMPLQVFLCDDRLCYHQPEQADAFGTDATSASPTSLRSRTAAAAGAMVSASMEGSPGLQLVGNYSGLGVTAGLGGTAAASLAALAAGEVRYIALDRIPVRPLPHRQHEFDPLARSHPDVGVTLVDDG